ncbi:MAG TPA: VOC family protein [Balneolaceae bacterium]
MKEEKLVVLSISNDSSLTIRQIKSNEKLVPATVSGCYPIFSVEDAQKTHDQLAKKGVKVDELMEGDGVIFFRFFDPDGNVLEACEVLE